MRRTWTEAFEFAQRIHAGQVDKQGRPYIEHLQAVVAGVSERSMRVALFHDSIEDRRTTWSELAKYTTREERAALLLMTHRKGMSYAAYIKRIKTAPGPEGEMARETKLSDLRHNHGRLIPELEHLRARYERAMAQLS